MIKKTLFSVIVGGSLLLAGTVQAATEPIIIWKNEHVTLQHGMKLERDRTLVSAEDVKQLLGVEIEQNDKHLMILADGKEVMRFTVDRSEAKIADRWITLDQGAISMGEQTYLPLRWIAEQLNYKVEWDHSERSIKVSEKAEKGGFNSIDESLLTVEQKAFVDQVKKQRGVHQLGNLYVIARGESPHPGYGLKIVDQVVSFNKLSVHVKLTEPAPEMMYPQVISYPYLVGIVKLPAQTTVEFIDADTEKVLFQK